MEETKKSESGPPPKPKPMTYSKWLWLGLAASAAGTAGCFSLWYSHVFKEMIYRGFHLVEGIVTLGLGTLAFVMFAALKRKVSPRQSKRFALIAFLSGIGMFLAPLALIIRGMFSGFETVYLATDRGAVKLAGWHWGIWLSMGGAFWVLTSSSMVLRSLLRRKTKVRRKPVDSAGTSPNENAQPQ